MSPLGDQSDQPAATGEKLGTSHRGSPSMLFEVLADVMVSLRLPSPRATLQDYKSFLTVSLNYGLGMGSETATGADEGRFVCSTRPLCAITDFALQHLRHQRSMWLQTCSPPDVRHRILSSYSFFSGSLAR